MISDRYVYIVILTTIFWLSGIFSILFSKKNHKTEKLAVIFTIVGILVLSAFIFSMWINLDRPLMRTLGETRLWYSFFLPIIGIIVFFRWRYKWFLIYGILLSLLFLYINLLKPEAFNNELMPALQSIWFVPHVIVYILAYALLAASSFVAIRGFFELRKDNFKEETLILADNLVYAGFAFLTAGLIFGALWAKEAWGHYWTWDPKETWAFLTWISYLAYIHIRYYFENTHKTLLVILAAAFVVLLVCWFGVNWLPSAQNSVHTYSG